MTLGSDSLIWPHLVGLIRPHLVGVVGGCDGLIWPHFLTRRGGYDGLSWPHRQSRRSDIRGGLGGPGGEVEGGVVRGDPAGSSPGGAVDPGVGRPVWGASEIWAAAGRSLGEVFVPQTHEPGAEAEVDFADLWIILAGVKTTVFLFTFRLSFSGKAVHRAFATQSQEAFLDGHVAAFEVLGGVPVVHVRYDNLKAAVSRVLSGRNRLESARWVSFRSHYGFDAFYCSPGRDGAHEKGGVEGEGGRFRRTHLVPMPRVDSLAELNTLLAGYDARDDARRIANRAHSVGHDFTVEGPVLASLPAEAFETGVTLSPRVDRYARVTVRQCRYSVPAKLIGRRVRVLLRATEVLVFDGVRQVAAHPRI